MHMANRPNTIDAIYDSPILNVDLSENCEKMAMTLKIPDANNMNGNTIVIMPCVIYPLLMSMTPNITLTKHNPPKIISHIY